MTPHVFWAKPNKSQAKVGVASVLIHSAAKQCRNGEMSRVRGKSRPHESESDIESGESESGKCSDLFCSKAMP